MKGRHIRKFLEKDTEDFTRLPQLFEQLRKILMFCEDLLKWNVKVDRKGSL